MTTLYMLTSQSSVQMMSFILKSDDKLLVIDGGNTCDADYLCTYVRKLGGVIDGWFITHAHSDHINALTSLLERHSEDVKIGKIYMNIPSDKFILRVEGERSLKYVERMRAQIADKKLEVVTVHKDDIYDFGEMKIRVLRVPDENIEFNGMNNSSVVYRLEADGKSVMFLGDLGVEGGNELLEKVPHELLKSDYVQLAHHGQQGVGKNLYDVIHADYCLWCTPDWLWDNNAGRGYDTHIWKTVVTRGWMSDIGVKWHYISKDGTQEVPLNEEKFKEFKN